LKLKGNDMEIENGTSCKLYTFNEFISQVNQISVGLTEYQNEKLDYFISKYCNRDTEFGRYYDIISFERFVKACDFDFWYEIQYIFDTEE